MRKVSWDNSSALLYPTTQSKARAAGDRGTKILHPEQQSTVYHSNLLRNVEYTTVASVFPIQGTSGCPPVRCLYWVLVHTRNHPDDYCTSEREFDLTLLPLLAELHHVQLRLLMPAFWGSMLVSMLLLAARW